MEKFWLIPIKEVGNFLSWWARVVPQGILVFTKELLLSFEDSLQFGANLRLWLAIEPMFGDYTWSGRTIGFLLRGIRVIITILVYLLILIGGILIVAGWYLFPFWALIKFQF